jgi:hypothetical protein
MNWSGLLAGAAKIFGSLANAGTAAEKVAPVLSKSVTYGQILSGLSVAQGLPWVDIAAAAQAQFRDPMKDAVAVEEIAAAVAVAIPPAASIAVTVEDIAKLIELLCALGIITTAPPSAPPKDGINPATGAPLFT